MRKRIHNMIDAHRRPVWMVWLVVLPLASSSRWMRSPAADKPMTSAKMGSATLEMMYVGAGILVTSR